MRSGRTWTLVDEAGLALMLTRIVRDESTHGRLGWLYLDWIAGTFDAAERARLYDAAVDTAGHIATLWEGPTRAVPPETTPPGFHDLGWMAPAAYVTLARRTMKEEVFGRLRTYAIGGVGDDVPASAGR